MIVIDIKLLELLLTLCGYFVSEHWLQSIATLLRVRVSGVHQVRCCGWPTEICCYGNYSRLSAWLVTSSACDLLCPRARWPYLPGGLLWLSECLYESASVSLPTHGNFRLLRSIWWLILTVLLTFIYRRKHLSHWKTLIIERLKEDIQCCGKTL